MRPPGVSEPVSHESVERSWTTEILDPITDPRWLGLVTEAPDACVFHHPAWLQLLACQYGFPMRACCIRDTEGRLLAGLPLATVRSLLTGRRLVALPFSDICSPLLACQAPPEVEQALGRSLSELAAAEGLDLQVHGDVRGAPAKRAGDTYVQHLVHIAGDYTEFERGLRPQVRKNIARARREDVEVHRRSDPAALDAFYRLHVSTRRRLGVPTQPKQFIQGMSDLFEQGHGFVLVATWQKQPIAANLVLTLGRTMTWKYSASDPRHLAKRPNNLVLAETIRIACDEGYSVFDFGRTEPENEGLRRYKRSYGGEERELTYNVLTSRPDRPPRSSPSTGVSRGRAYGLAARGMQHVIRRGPPLVGVLIGRLLYRHTA